MSVLDLKICLVTGASKGIGKAVAEKFAEAGAIVYANARVEGSIDNWASEFAAKYDTEVYPLYFDVTKPEEVKSAVQLIKKRSKTLDVLVNNAGVVSYALLPMLDEKSLREMVEVNIIAPIQITQLVSRIMSRQQGGSIINLSSIVAVNGVEGQAAYSATKGAMISFTKSLAKELAASKVRVNAVAPGMISTDRIKKTFDTTIDKKLSSIGMARMGSPEEVADLCVFLASDKSSYITGQIIGIDGSTTF